jgi:hypothetical protein
VGHRRGTGRRRGVAVSGPSSGLRRCLDPCRSPSPASPSIIPDGEISPVRLEAKAFPVEPSRLIRGSSDGAHTPRVMWFAPRLVRSVFSRFSGHSVPARSLLTEPPLPRAPSLRRRYPPSTLLRAHAPIPAPPISLSAIALWEMSSPLAPSTAGRGNLPAFGLPFFPGVLRPLRRRFLGCT